MTFCPHCDFTEMLIAQLNIERVASVQEYLDEHGPPTEVPCLIYDESDSCVKAWHPDRQEFILVHTRITGEAT